MRSPIAIALLLLCSCAPGQPRIPEGIHAVAEEEPPPSPDAIRQAQERLTALGVYDGAVDGELGARTRVALARFQRLSGMTPSGLLDRATIDALEQASAVPRETAARGGVVGRGPPGGAPVLPSAAQLLEDEGAVPDQPPPGALCGALADAAALLEQARGTTARRLAEGAPSTGIAIEDSPSGVIAAKAAPEAPTAVAPPAATASELRNAELRLSDAREAAFDRLVDARREGGWALLPHSLALDLERELARQSLLLRTPDGRLGPDAASAIAWVQRSHGRTPTGVPTIGLLEILGIDPAPMFEEEEEGACASINRR